jgi:hypothetical protein
VPAESPDLPWTGERGNRSRGVEAVSRGGESPDYPGVALLFRREPVS